MLSWQISALAGVDAVLNPSVCFWFFLSENNGQRQTILTNRKPGQCQGSFQHVVIQKTNSESFNVRGTCVFDFVTPFRLKCTFS